MAKDKRPSAAKRGYDHAWRKFRKDFLIKNPICCRQGCREPATDVDHEPPLTGPDDPGRLDPARCAPLCHAHHSEKTGKQTAAKNYDEYKESQAAISRERSQAGREIGPLPDVVNPKRRAKCEADPERFAKTYFPRRFRLPFASFHHVAFEMLEDTIRNGGNGFLAMPRASGKDTLTEVMVLRAVLYAFRRYVVFINAIEKASMRSLKKLKQELEANPLLLEDFPEVCYPIRRLERIHNRAAGQTLDGVPTRMEWTADSMIMPHVEGSAAGGAVIQVAALTGSIRGLTVLGPDGEPMRPDLVVVNDAQTRESAKSPTQTADREAIVMDDIGMLVDPDETLAMIQLGTCIYRNDLTWRFLDKDKHPEVNSIRTRMLESFPKNMDLWDRYGDIRRNGMREGDKGKAGNEFYEENREAMDEGGAVSWPDRKKKGELTGLQSAMNFFIDNPRGFHAEGQNDPEAAELAGGAKELSKDAIAARFNGVDRYMIPDECSRLTAFIDVGGGVHWYAVAALNESFGGAIVDYGAWPRQNRTYFEASDPRPSLKDTYPSANTDAQRAYAGLADLTAELMRRTYYRQGGGEMQIELCLIDSGWETKAVYDFIRSSPFASRLRPSKGYARTTTSRGINEWKPRPGERKGYFWRLTQGEHGRIQCVQFDPDAWKSFLHAALTVPPGGQTGLRLFGKTAAVHEMLANHLAAEYSLPVTLRGTTFDKWEIRPERPDNHLLDCVVGSLVAASVGGLTWSATGRVDPPQTAPRKKHSDRQREKMQARGAAI